MKLKHLFESYLADFKAIIDHHGLDIRKQDHGKTGLKFMYLILYKARENRAYDDSHPGFASGRWPRILPYNGTDYCEYYQNNCHDTHVATLLRAIKEELMK